MAESYAFGSPEEAVEETPQETVEEPAATEEPEGEQTTEEPQEGQQDLLEATEKPEEAEKEEEAEGPQEEPEPEEEKPPEPQIHRFRLEGQDVEVTTEQLVQGFQLAETSRRRLQEAANYTRAAKEVIDRVSQDPFGTAEQLLSGILGSAEKATAQIKETVLKKAAQYLEEDMLPEEKREALMLQRELDATRQRLESLKNQQEAEAQRAAEQAALVKADEEIAEAFSSSGLDPTPENYDAVMRMMVRHIDAGLSLTAAQAASKVKENISSKPRELPKLTPEEIEKADPDLLRRIREYDLARVRARQLQPSGGRNGPATGRPLQPASPRRDGAKKPPEWNDFFDHFK